MPERPRLLAALALEPGLGLVGREADELGLHRTAARAARPRVQPAERLVRRDEHEDLQRPWPIRPSTTFSRRDRPWPVRAFASAASSSPVSSSTSSRQRLGVVLVVLVVEQDVEHVRRARAEERLRVGDVVEVAPPPPLPAERAQGDVLPVPGSPCQRISRPPTPGSKRLAHQPAELGRDRGGVVVGDLGPGRHVDLRPVRRPPSRPHDQNVMPIRCPPRAARPGYHSRSAVLRGRERVESVRRDDEVQPSVLQREMREAVARRPDRVRSTIAVRRRRVALRRRVRGRAPRRATCSRSATRTTGSG